MGRSHVRTITQPDEVSCGPVSIKHALEVFGKKKPLTTLIALCKTTRNGTSAKNMIHALNELGFAVLAIEKANLKHLTSALRHTSSKPRAVIVSYLYADDAEDAGWKESGHWAAVSSFSASKNKIVLFDSYYGTRKSYTWSDFRARWMDFDKKKRRIPSEKTFRYVKKWQKQFALIIAKKESHLPKFKIRTANIHIATNV